MDYPTYLTEIAVTPANAELVSDWSTDNLIDWMCPSGPGTTNVVLTPMSDGILGDFIRLSNVTNRQHLYGRQLLSPRYDFELEFNFRCSPATGIHVGFYSGDSNVVSVITMNGHPTLGNLDGNTSPISDLPNMSYNESSSACLWATCYPIVSTDGITSSVGTKANTHWRWRTTAGHADHSKWLCPTGQKNTILFKYIAATTKVEIYINSVLACTVGDTHAPPSARKRYPVGEHYPLPISPFISTEVGFDLGEVRISTACPYDYAAYAQAYTGMEDESYADWYEWSDPVQTMNKDMAPWMGLSGLNAWATMRRFGVDLFSGATLLPNNKVITRGDALIADYAVEGLDEDENPIMIPDDPQYLTWAAGTTTVKSPFISVPVGKPIVYYSLLGLEQYGTLRCRLLNQNDIPLNAYTNVDGIYAVDLSSMVLDLTTKIRVEVEITYDGSLIDTQTAYVGGDIYGVGSAGYARNADYEAVTPNTPSLFIGFETYFTDSFMEGSDMASSLSDRYKARVVALQATSTTRYKATFHSGVSRPTVATTVYAATGLGELSTTTNYTTGGVGLTGGVQLNATLSGDNLTFADVTITSAVGETIGPVDTIAVWDTSDSNGLLFIVDLQATVKTASEGGTFVQDFPAVTLAVVRSVA